MSSLLWHYRTWHSKLFTKKILTVWSSGSHPTFYHITNCQCSQLSTIVLVICFVWRGKCLLYEGSGCLEFTDLIYVREIYNNHIPLLHLQAFWRDLPSNKFKKKEKKNKRFHGLASSKLLPTTTCYLHTFYLFWRSCIIIELTCTIESRSSILSSHK